MGATSASEKSHALQFRLRGLLIVFVALSVLLAASGWYYRTYVEPMHQARAVERQLHALATRRPADMSPRQWESAVAWTSNLHGNSLLPFQADGATIRRFEERLAEKLDGEVHMDTIHWIWDEYARLCPGGANYQRFRPMMMEEIEAGGGNWGMNVP